MALRRIPTRFILVTFVLIVISISGCNREGSELIGNWQGPETLITVEKIGDTFVVTSQDNEGRQLFSSPAKYDSGYLVIDTGVGNMQFYVDTKTNELVLTAVGTEEARWKRQ